MRVVSLLPSATEIVALVAGLGEGAGTGAGPAPGSNAAGGPAMPRVELVGRSHECDRPEAVRTAPVLTRARTTFSASAQVDAEVSGALAAGQSLYELDTARLADLRPDLVVTQDLCRVCSIDLETVRAAVARMHPAPRVLSLNPGTLEAVLDDVLRVAEAVGLVTHGEAAVVALRERMYRAADYVNPYADGPIVAVLEWTDPLYIAGHWTPQIVERAGGRHPLNPTRIVPGAGAAEGPVGVTQREASASRRITPDELVAAAPDVLVVAPCGLTLEQAQAELAVMAREPWFDALPAARRARERRVPAIAVVDGNQMFSRPGPRLVDALEWLTSYLTGVPSLCPRGFPWSPWPG